MQSSGKVPEDSRRRLLDQTKLDSAAALEKANADAAAREAAVREESKRLTETALQGRISEAELAKNLAETKATAAEEAARVLKETHESPGHEILCG